MTLERLRGVLAAIGLQASAPELTEILWLACQLSPGQAPAIDPSGASHTSDHQGELSGTREEQQAAPQPQAGSGARLQSGTSGEIGAQGLYAESVSDGQSLSVRAVQVPTAPMLPDPLAVQRALRPLKRRVASRRADVIDEDATARRIAEQPAHYRRWVPVMQSSPERWLSLALVVDTGPSMWIWRPLARELQEALTRLGAFRNVRIWYLTGAHVAASPGAPRVNPAALLDPSGSQACLMLSDCCGAHWWNGSAVRALHLWGRSGPTAILQPLAERLWARTSTPPVPGLGQARRAAAPNTELRFTPYDAGGVGLPIPVMEIAPSWLADWARLVAGPSTPPLPMAVAYVSGKPRTRTEPLQRERDLPISERVQRFQASASPEAVRLAAHVAVSVPTLPVIRLIHHQMLRNPQPGHIAEVLLSGLLRPDEAQPGIYEFIPGARQALLATLPRSESWHAAQIVSRLSSEIESRLGGAGEAFRAYLHAPQGISDRAFVSRQPFALVSPEALRYLRRDTITPPLPPREPTPPSTDEASDLGKLAATAGRLLDRLPAGQRAAFSQQLPTDLHLAVLRALSGLPLAADSVTLDLDSRERVESALSTFARESTKPNGRPDLMGAVMEITSLVEATTRTFLSRLAYSAYGDNSERMQRDLKLPTRDIRNLTLGKVVQALRIAATLEAFADVQESISQYWLDRLEAFVHERNFWAHGAVSQTEGEAVDRAFWTMREGILIAGRLTDGMMTIPDRQESSGGAEEALGPRPSAPPVPDLDIDVVSGPLARGEWDELRLRLRSAAPAPLHGITLSIDGPLKIAPAGARARLPDLAEGQAAEVSFIVCPTAAGRRVPAAVVVNYTDGSGHARVQKQLSLLEVSSQSSAGRGSASPGRLQPGEVPLTDRHPVLVLTALDLEYQAVRAHLTGLRVHRHAQGTIFETGHLPGSTGEITIALTGEGNAGAAVLSERAMNMFGPQALLFVGVAGALKDDIDLGDVVVATRIFAYHGSKEEDDGVWTRPRSWEAPHELEQLAHFIARARSWAGYLPAAAAGQLPTVHFKPIAAGEVLLASRTSETAQRLHDVFNDAAAIEMESAGLSQASQFNRSLPALIIRGISDRADGSKHVLDKAGWQPRAAAHAAAFAVAMAAEIIARDTGEPGASGVGR